MKKILAISAASMLLAGCQTTVYQESTYMPPPRPIYYEPQPRMVYVPAPPVRPHRVCRIERVYDPVMRRPVDRERCVIR